MKILTKSKKQYKWYQNKFNLFIIFIALIVIVWVIVSQINAYSEKQREPKLNPCQLGNQSWIEETKTFLSSNPVIPFNEANCSPIPSNSEFKTICKI